MNLKEMAQKASQEKKPIWHFNVGTAEMLKAVAEASKESGKPVIIGVSEREREFIGIKQIKALVDVYRNEGVQLFLNADHTFMQSKVREVVEAGFDSIVFDAAKYPIDENIKLTKEAVEIVRSSGKDILIEAEIGFIGHSSKLLENMPEGVSLDLDKLTTVEATLNYVKETGIDMVAPAVGTIHGIVKNMKGGFSPDRLGEIVKASPVPVVLHGGSGLTDDEFRGAAETGVAIIHVSTDLRLAWRGALDKVLTNKKEEVTPHGLLPDVIEAVKEAALAKLRLW